MSGRRWRDAAGVSLALFLVALMSLWSDARAQECTPSASPCGGAQAVDDPLPPSGGDGNVIVEPTDPQPVGVGDGTASGDDGGGTSVVTANSGTSGSTGGASSSRNGGGVSGGTGGHGAAGGPAPALGPPHAVSPGIGAGPPGRPPAANRTGSTESSTARGGSGSVSPGAAPSPAPAASDPSLGELATTAGSVAAATPEEPPAVLRVSHQRARTGWPVVVFAAGLVLLIAGLARRRSAVAVA